MRFGDLLSRLTYAARESVQGIRLEVQAHRGIALRLGGFEHIARPSCPGVVSAQRKSDYENKGTVSWHMLKRGLLHACTCACLNAHNDPCILSHTYTTDFRLPNARQ